MSKTPVVANLAQYLRLNYLSDNLLEEYVIESSGNVDCADMEFLRENSNLKITNIFGLLVVKLKIE